MRNYLPVPFVCLLLSQVCSGFRFSPAMGAVKMIGHRGASGVAPENTMAAFREAFRMNADGIELDVHLSADGKALVIHDKDLQRVSGISLRVSEASFSLLRRYDVGSWKDKVKYKGEKIPLLTEVLKSVPESKLVYIELKGGGENLVKEVSRVADLFSAKKARMVIIGFDFSLINLWKKLQPEVKAYYLVCSKGSGDQHYREIASLAQLDSLVKEAKFHSIDGIDFQYSDFITSQNVERVKREGLDVAVWADRSMDSLTSLEASEKAGVISYTGNYPDRNFPPTH